MRKGKCYYWNIYVPKTIKSVSMPRRNIRDVVGTRFVLETGRYVVTGLSNDTYASWPVRRALINFQSTRDKMRLSIPRRDRTWPTTCWRNTESAWIKWTYLKNQLGRKPKVIAKVSGLYWVIILAIDGTCISFDDRRFLMIYEAE